jgi:hypothetical protein
MLDSSLFKKVGGAAHTCHCKQTAIKTKTIRNKVFGTGWNL